MRSVQPWGTPFSVFAALLVFASCTPQRFAERRARLADEADWIAQTFSSRAAQADGPDAAILKLAYIRGEQTARRVATSCRAASSYLKSPQGYAEAEGELTAAREAVARVLANVAARRDMVTRLDARTQEIDEAARTATPSPAPGITAAKKRPVLDALSAVQTAATPDALAIAIDHAREALQKSEPQDPTANATKHGQLKVLVDGEIARVTALLDAEKKKDANGPKVPILEGAAAALQKAKAVLAPTATPSSPALADAEKELIGAQNAIAKAQETPTVFPSPWFRAHAGLVTLSPYVVTAVPPDQNGSGERFRLARADGGPDFYLEMDFFGRMAWLAPENSLERTPDYGLRFLPDWLLPDDYEGRIRLTNNDKIDSQSSAVGGDITVETLVGWNLAGIGLESAEAIARDRRLAKRPRGTINLELGTGFVTDSDSIDAHPHVEGGLGTAWSFPLEVAANEFRLATLYTGLYYGLFDFPQIDTDDVQYVDERRPQYNSIGTLSGRIDAAIPITGNLDVVVGVRYWDPVGSSRRPESWSVFVGISVPLGKLLEAVTKS